MQARILAADGALFQKYELVNALYRAYPQDYGTEASKEVVKRKFGWWYKVAKRNGFEQVANQYWRIAAAQPPIITCSR